MGLEIITSRILTPVFGSTIYTWGSLIGVILSGLSVGYLLGGKVADGHPNFEKISGIVFSVGLFIIGIPFFASPVVKGRSLKTTTSIKLFLIKFLKS